MTTHTDLIARLRRGWTTDCLLAADALEALEQQVAALTNERNDLLILLDNWKTSQGVTEDQLAAAQARESKLRKQLQRVIGCHNPPNDCYSTGPLTGNEFVDLVSCPSCEAEALLALPTDDSALMERLKEERERCAKVCDGLESTGGLWDASAAIRRMT